MQNRGNIKLGGETVNFSWDNKQTAFYYKSVVKINA